ncbi:hypothetical protein ACVB8X_40755 [Streptomyces sp. NRAIS4]
MRKTIKAAMAAASMVLAVAPTASAATPNGSAFTVQVFKADDKTATVEESIRCRESDTATLEIIFSQTVESVDDPGAYGRTTVQVPCGPTIEYRKIQVPITRDGPVTAGKWAAIASVMRNSAGKELHRSNALEPIH